MDDIEIVRDRLEDSARKEVSLNPSYMISKDAAWSYSNQAQSTIDWRYSVNPTWSSYNPGLFPTVDANTRYYATSVTVPPSEQSYPSFEFGVYSREGVVVYINGEEVIRKNLPTYVLYKELNL
jgi:hypothetical protein